MTAIDRTQLRVETQRLQRSSNVSTGEALHATLRRNGNGDFRFAIDDVAIIDAEIAVKNAVNAASTAIRNNADSNRSTLSSDLTSNANSNRSSLASTIANEEAKTRTSAEADSMVRAIVGANMVVGVSKSTTSTKDTYTFTRTDDSQFTVIVNYTNTSKNNLLSVVKDEVPNA